MPEPTTRHDPQALEATALRYAARELSAVDAEAFEARLADDQAARDALAEAVRLSAAALGQEPPRPDRSFRRAIRERVKPLGVWWAAWLARRAYRGHPAAWLGLGAGVVAAATLVGLNLAGQETHAARTSAAETGATPELAPAPRPFTQDMPVAPEPQAAHPPEAVALVSADHAPHATEACNGDASARRAAEIWAELSTPDHVEKAVEDEARWRHRLKDLHMGNHGHPARPAVAIDSHDP